MDLKGHGGGCWKVTSVGILLIPPQRKHLGEATSLFSVLGQHGDIRAMTPKVTSAAV